MEPASRVATLFDRLLNHPILTAEQERYLIQQAKKGDKKAESRLIECNARLVYAIAKRYHGPLSLPDAFQEGVIGLKHAIVKFDPERGGRLSTCATYWIKRAVHPSRWNPGLIRLPAYMRDLVSRYEVLCYQSGKLKLTPDEVAIALKVDPVKAVAVMNAAVTTKAILSLNHSSCELTNGREQGDDIEDKTAQEPFFDQIHPSLVEAISRLSPNQQKIIHYIYVKGLGAKETSRLLNLSINMVRQHHAKAMKRLRNLVRANAVL